MHNIDPGRVRRQLIEIFQDRWGLVSRDSTDSEFHLPGQPHGLRIKIGTSHREVAVHVLQGREVVEVIRINSEGRQYGQARKRLASWVTQAQLSQRAEGK